MAAQSGVTASLWWWVLVFIEFTQSGDYLRCEISGFVHHHQRTGYRHPTKVTLPRYHSTICYLPFATLVRSTITILPPYYHPTTTLLPPYYHPTTALLPPYYHTYYHPTTTPTTTLLPHLLLLLPCGTSSSLLSNKHNLTYRLRSTA